MKRIKRADAMGYWLRADIEPVLEVDLNESFVVETEDAFSGYIRRPEDRFSPESIPPLRMEPVGMNPVAGPIYIRGVGKGDVLVVHIEEIEPWEQGVSCIMPGVGPLKDSLTWPECAGPFTKIIPHQPGPDGKYATGKAVWNDRMSWDLRPMIGTIATAPEWEQEAAIVAQGPWGGNMDVSDMCKGTKAMFPSYHEGGLLFVGDVAGCQGDTEFHGAHDDTPATVKLRCDVIKNKKIPWVRLEKEDSIVQICCDKPLESAVEQAVLWLVQWLVDEYGFEKRDAYMLMACCPGLRVRVYQMVSTGKLRYTAGAEFSKRYLP
ncbi:MAG: acetamidase/formamidase family protein [Deltaproteobacteria bacterium]|nr:acetamidase/formamidase family protein [Deltaproteobacteria bacterium]